MAYFMLQLDWATVFRYLVKHFSGCFCEDVPWIRLRFKSVEFE